MRHPGEQHTDSLEEVGPEHSIALFGDVASPIDFVGGIAARLQPNLGANAA